MRVGWRVALALMATLAVANCASIGPATIKRDRTDYSGAIATSWKEQMLLNVVKFRYFDTPVFVDVSSVVSTQEMSTQGDASARLVPDPLATATRNFYNLGVTGKYTDRPTISYTPITGNRFINTLLRPIPPQTIFGMIDSGHDARFLLSLAVRSINGVYNYSLSPGRARPENPKFRQVAAAIRRIQQAGAIGTRKGKTGKASSTWVFFRHNARGAVEEDIRLVKRLLGLAPQRDEFVLTGGPNHTPNQIAVLTRSMHEILTELAAGVDVPAEDLAEGRATRVPVLNGATESRPLIHIHSSSEPPSNAYVSIHYRDRWFWVSDRELSSKRVFMFLMIFSALSETRAEPHLPIVTIPTN